MDAERASALLSAAAGGDQRAWNEIVDEYVGLVWSVARGFRLDAAATEDVVQTVWLRLAEHCRRIRQPERLAGWLATTTRNEALRVLRGHQREAPVDDVVDLVAASTVEIDSSLLADEELDEVLAAFRALDAETQTFLRWLCTVPPLDYKTISEISGRPIGSIGPTRARCVEKLRRELDRRRSNPQPGADA